jgi:hypothetical protein
MCFGPSTTRTGSSRAHPIDKVTSGRVEAPDGADDAAVVGHLAEVGARQIDSDLLGGHGGWVVRSGIAQSTAQNKTSSAVP